MKFSIFSTILFPLVNSRFTPDPDGNFRLKFNQPHQATLNFTVLGDWGGMPRPFYTTPLQLSAARLLGQVSTKINSQFTLAIGDNFYFSGVNSIYEDRWEQTFSRVYTDKSLQKPWYPILGNHDWRGNYSAQIDYSRINNRWSMPNLWYSLEYHLENFKIKIIMIDSQVHCDVDLETNKPNQQYKIPPTQQQKDDQFEFIKKELQTSDQQQFDYIFLVSHYQIYTPYSHKSCMFDIDELIKKHKITAFINGHVHDSEHLISKDTYSDMNYFCTGTGALKNKPHGNDELEDQVKGRDNEKSSME